MPTNYTAREAVIVEDETARRFRILPGARATEIDVSDWLDPAAYEITSGSERIFREIAPDDYGEVELLAYQECANCQGAGGFVHEVDGDQMFPGRGWVDHGSRCEVCAGHGKLWDSFAPWKRVTLASLASTAEAA